MSVDITHEHLDRDISALEIEYVMKSLRNGKASGSDGIAGELIKYGGNGMIMAKLIHVLKGLGKPNPRTSLC